MAADRVSVRRWVAGYEAAWRDSDADAVERLFTPDARYARSPYDPEELVGHAAIRGFWTVDTGATFTMAAEPLAVEGDVAVVRVEVRYTAPREQEYRDLWVLRFAPDGRVVDFEEWAYWPGKAWSAAL
ncbi:MULTISPECIES: YybH family protein [unclassified Isoptericola]|uniref:YybH family protein n=1 Tax=unclassified Isoptericola TaxID=2623355 RepID=UPI003663E1B0